MTNCEASPGLDWVVNEFRHIDIGDDRLLERFIVTAQLLAARPLDNINKACGNWAATKGAYRLFENERLEACEIFASHQTETALRVKSHRLVFALQDTTFLDFDSHPKTVGLGSVGKGYGKRDKLGLVLHPSLIVTELGLPLGLLSLNCWARKPQPARTRSEKSAENYRKSQDEKESRKWQISLKETAECVLEDTRIITIGDREADIYEFLNESLELGHGFVIRSRINRRTQKNKYRAPKMWEHLDKLSAVGLESIEIPGQQGRPARTAKVEVKFSRVTTPIRENLRYGAHHKHELPDEISFYAIKLIELDPPSEDEKIDWTLITSEPVRTMAEAIEKVSWYKLRWQIEIFFRILKSGCKVESSRLSKVDRLQKYIALMSIIAWRIFFLDQIARRTPAAPCSTVLTQEQWQALYCRIHQTSHLPKKEPNTEEVVRWIARLGGFLNRKGDGPPGPMVLWRGWQVLEEIMPMWLILKPTQPP